MMRRPVGLIAAVAVSLGAFAASGATISFDGDTLTYAGADRLEIMFCKCMANDLFTFRSVKLGGKLINSAEHSDNIGPFLVDGAGWIGGNHLSDSGETTARTVDVAVSVEGRPLRYGTCEGEAVEVLVTNELYMPGRELFAVETMTYLVAGNSIEVRAEHLYKMSGEATIDRYYGMQSMAQGESAILLPGGWVAIDTLCADLRLKRSEAPGFEAFVERTEAGCQACLMLPEGLGTRSRVAPDDVVFIGNSYGKCYHKLMGRANVQPGDSTCWHGVYSWFDRPATDTFGSDSPEPELTYPAYIGGQPVAVTIDGSGRASITKRL